MQLLDLPNEILTLILINIEHIPSILRFGQSAKVINSILLASSGDELIYRPAVLALNSSIDLQICKTVPGIEETEATAAASWKRAGQIYYQILHNLNRGLENVTCPGTIWDPIRSIKNQIPPTFGRPVESFNNFMTDANIDSGLVYAISNWRDPDFLISSATICFDFIARKYRVIPVQSESETAEYPMYNDPGLPREMRWDFSDMTQRRCLKRIGDVIVMFGLTQPGNEFHIVARNHSEELWRIPSPVANLNILSTCKYLITISEFPRYSVYNIKTGDLIISGKAPFSTDSISCATETHYIVFNNFTLYAISWDDLIQAPVHDDFQAVSSTGPAESPQNLEQPPSVHLSQWTSFGNINKAPFDKVSNFQDFSFFGHSFGFRYIALELYAYENAWAYILDLYNGTLAEFLLSSPKVSGSHLTGRTEPNLPHGSNFNWTGPMERSLMNEYGPRLLQGHFYDPRHFMFFWAVDQKGTVVFISSLVLTQLGRVYCDRGGELDIRFSDYL